MPEAELRRRLVERQITLRCAVEIYCLQLAGRRHFLHEHPATSASWKAEELEELEEQGDQLAAR